MFSNPISMAPVRIRLERRAGWRMPHNTVKVDRSTRWGNPLRIKAGSTAAEAVADYTLWITGDGEARFGGITQARPSLQEIRLHLGGKNLACWCALGAPCHADV